MTLTGRVAPSMTARVRAAIDEVFRARCSKRRLRWTGWRCLSSREPGAPFMVQSYVPLGRRQ